MARLVSPTSAVRDSYIAGELAMCAEEGVSTDLVTDAQENFESTSSGAGAVRTHWGVPVTELWYVDRSEYIGTVIVRHRLSPELEIVGGHIGFHVVPAYRRQGNARQMLTEARRYARARVRVRDRRVRPTLRHPTAGPPTRRTLRRGVGYPHTL